MAPKFQMAQTFLIIRLNVGKPFWLVTVLSKFWPDYPFLCDGSLLFLPFSWGQASNDDLSVLSTFVVGTIHRRSVERVTRKNKSDDLRLFEWIIPIVWLNTSSRPSSAIRKWVFFPIRSQLGRYIKQLELCVTKNVSQEVQMIVIINYRAIFKA